MTKRFQFQSNPTSESKFPKLRNRKSSANNWGKSATVRGCDRISYRRWKMDGKLRNGKEENGCSILGSELEKIKVEGTWAVAEEIRDRTKSKAKLSKDSFLLMWTSRHEYETHWSKSVTVKTKKLPLLEKFTKVSFFLSNKSLSI